MKFSHMLILAGLAIAAFVATALQPPKLEKVHSGRTGKGQR